MIIENERVNNEFYTCPVYNYMIKGGAKIGIYNIKFELMNGIGTPEDLKNYLSKWSFSKIYHFIGNILLKIYKL